MCKRRVSVSSSDLEKVVRNPLGHLEKEDIPFLKEQSLHTFVYANFVPESCEESVCVVQQRYKNVGRLGQWACSVHL